MEPAGPPFPVPGIRVTMTVQHPTGRQIGFETVVEQTIHADDFDDLLDKMAHVADRQQAKVDLLGHEQQLLMAQTKLDHAAKDLVKRRAEYAEEAMATGRRNPRPSQQQRANLEQIQHEIDQLKLDIEARKETMAKCRAMIDRKRPVLAEAAE